MRAWIACLAGIVTVPLLSGCGTTSKEGAGPAAGTWLTAHQALHEYRAETRRLTLAPGNTWESHPSQLNSLEQGHKVMYEAGIGAQTAQFRWYCSWASAAVADPQTRPRALEELRAFPSMTVWKAMDSYGKQMFEENLAEAQRGKLEKLTEYVTGNCRDASSSPESSQ